MKTSLILVLFALCNFSQTAYAQSMQDAGVFGIVADSISKKPLGYVTLSLKDEKRQAIKADLSKDNGAFSFAGLKRGNYVLAAASVGYSGKSIAVDLRDSIPNGKDLGTIYLSPQSKNLKEVTITGDRPIISQEPDRIAYDLQADPESKVSNVLEMMRKVPMLSVDGEDNIQLKGQSNYKIFINGKPSSMMERNARDVLRSMPASSIQKIEVITTPPAKYDAEGLSGIINIITNKKVDNGYNGNINTSYRFPVGGPGTGGSFTAKQGKFGASGYGGASIYNTPTTTRTISRITGSNDLWQSGERRNDSNSGYFGSELSFEIDTLNLISGQFNVNGNQSNGNTFQNSVARSAGAVSQRYDLNDAGRGDGSGFDGALNYQKGFKADKNRLLTFSYRYYTFKDIGFNEITVNNPAGVVPVNSRQNNEGLAREQTVQVDYSHPYRKLVIEAGVKGIFRTNSSVFSYDTLQAPSLYVRDDLRSNTFNNHQTVYGIYNSYQYNIKTWGFRGGLRLEQTIIEGSSNVKQDYYNLVPSLSVNKKLTKTQSLALGYSQRIGRPGIGQLNPFVDRSNPNFESTGNPDLRPMTVEAVDLKYSNFKKGSINLSIGYEFYDKLIMPASVYNAQTNKTRTNPDNTGSATVLEGSMNINYPLTKKWNISTNAFAGYGKVRGRVNNVLMENEGLMYHINASTGYRFDSGWRLNALVNMQGPNLTLQGTSNRFTGSSFSVNKDVIKDKLSFSASASNPYSKFRMNRQYTNGTGFSQEFMKQSYMRSFNTSINYKFGQLKSGLKKSKKGIINDDVSAGSGSNQ